MKIDRYEEHSALTARSLIAAVIIFIFIPNMLFWVATWSLGIIRPVINLDYLVVGIVFSVGWKRSGIVLLATALLLDILVVQSEIYPVTRIRDIAYLLTLLPYASAFWITAIIGLSAVIIFTSAMIYRVADRTNRLSALTLLFSCIILYAIQINIVSNGSDFTRSKLVATGSQSTYFIVIHSISVLDSYYSDQDILRNIGFRKDVQNWIDTPPEGQSNKLLLIVVESWGVMRDTSMQDAVLAPILSLKSHFKSMEIGHVSAGNATLAGELHALCGLEAAYFNLKPVTEGFEHCLPWSLKSKGYKTFAMHGAAGVVYERKFWYPRVGFDKILFQDNHIWSTHCHSFSGACDKELMTELPRIFSEDGNIFAYWLTLNSHTPYDARDIWISKFDCRAFQIDENSEICRLNKLHAQFFHQLAQILADSALSGADVILIGDHAPPILNRTEYDEYYYPGLVSQMHIRVKY